MGDLNKSDAFFSPSPAVGLGIQLDHNLRYSFNLMGSYNPLKGSMKYAEEYVLPGIVEEFSNKLIDLSLTAEFNFLPYECYNIKKRNFSPFVFAGIGTSYFLSDGSTKFPVTIPFGLGIKYNIFERFSIGIKWMAKKIFYDEMDGFENIYDPDNKPRIHNDDWYPHGFVFLTFKPFRKYKECPTYEE